ncbi:MAG: hypothetical protein IH931_07845 [candidate division Zixibacteria bacterium]|nr:hypothetical protein [candidate division Zixibacteria bacterium]
MNDKTYRNEAIDIQLANHIRSCRSCSAHAAASQILNRAFRIERVKSAESETPLPFLKARIEALASHRIVKEHNVMSSLKDRIFNHPLMSFSFAGAFVMLLLAATVPVSCSRTVGYSVGVAGDDSPIAEAITSDADGTASITFQKNSEGHMARFDSKRIVGALNTLGISNAKIEFSASELGQTMTISGLESREQARDALLAIVEVAGFGDKAELTHRQASVSSTLLEHALSGIHKILVNNEGLSDKEVHRHIIAQLEEAGITGADVHYLNDIDGQIGIFIEQSGENDGSVTKQVIEWKTDGGDGTFNFEGNDSAMIIDIRSDDNTQTIDIKKTISSDSDK